MKANATCTGNPPPPRRRRSLGLFPPEQPVLEPVWDRFRMTFTSPPSRQQDDLLLPAVAACFEPIQVDACGHQGSKFIAAVPLRGPMPRLIELVDHDPNPP